MLFYFFAYARFWENHFARSTSPPTIIARSKPVGGNDVEIQQ